MSSRHRAEALAADLSFSGFSPVTYREFTRTIPACKHQLSQAMIWGLMLGQRVFNFAREPAARETLQRIRGTSV